MNESFNKILEIIKQKKQILITSHKNPDGDAIGSSLALILGLNKLNKQMRKIADENNEIYVNMNLRLILDGDIPTNLKFLSHSILAEKISNYSSKYQFDLIICLDSANFDRIGQVQNLKDEKTTIINIDHHISNSNYGDYNYIEDLSSTSEIIFNFLTKSNIELDFEMAESLYTGIINDTGNFKHSNTTKKVFEIAAELLQYGVKPNMIANEFYGTKTIGQLKLMGKVLSNFKFVNNINLVYYYISIDEMTKLGATKEDAEGLVNLLLSYKNSSFSLLLREKENGKLKGSLRSKYNIDVNALANIFGGGGHIKAAGFETSKKRDDIIELINKNMNIGGKQ